MKIILPSIFIAIALYYIITGVPPHIWTTPYQDLEWRYRWFVQPIVKIMQGLTKVVNSFIKD